jgi:hypothetical protein
MSLDMQRQGNNFSAEQNNHATTEYLLEVAFSMHQRAEAIWGLRFSVNASVEVRSNMSNVALRVVGDDEMEPSTWGYNVATMFLENIETGTYRE